MEGRGVGVGGLDISTNYVLSSGNLPGLYIFMRSFLWDKTWGLNWSASEGMAKRLYENLPQQGFFVIIFAIFVQRFNNHNVCHVWLFEPIKLI